jgi:hypothetical protein
MGGTSFYAPRARQVVMRRATERTMPTADNAVMANVIWDNKRSRPVVWSTSVQDKRSIGILMFPDPVGKNEPRSAVAEDWLRRVVAEANKRHRMGAKFGHYRFVRWTSDQVREMSRLFKYRYVYLLTDFHDGGSSYCRLPVDRTPTIGIGV